MNILSAAVGTISLRLTSPDAEAPLKMIPVASGKLRSQLLSSLNLARIFS